MDTKILLKLIEDMLNADTGKKSAKKIEEINKKFREEIERS
jgi:hypothetical protein